MMKVLKNLMDRSLFKKGVLLKRNDFLLRISLYPTENVITSTQKFQVEK